jgi:hypothetical protein
MFIPDGDQKTKRSIDQKKRERLRISRYPKGLIDSLMKE